MSGMKDNSSTPEQELFRQRSAAERGLAPEASWTEINAHDRAQRRIGGTALQ